MQLNAGNSSGSLINLSYTYDKVGSVKTIGDNLIGNTQTFGYDDLNRLTTASAPAATDAPAYSHTYAYNKLGNITSFAGNTYTYGSAAHIHAVTAITGGQSFGYDANGNMTSRTDLTGTYTQIFDVENRLTSVTKTGTGTTTFAYDAGGNRVKTIQPNGSTLYTPFPNYEEETRSGGVTIKRTTYAIAGQVIAVRVTGDPASGNNGISYFFNDHASALLSTGLGSNAALRQPNGAVVTTRYLPFGGYRGAAPTQTVTDRDFTGQRENMELGLLYYNARFYAPGK